MLCLLLFFFKVPEQNCIELLSLRLSISQLHKDIDKTDSQSPNIKSSFKLGSIKSPVQHSFSFKHLLHPKCVEQSGCSRSLSKIPYSSTQTLASIHKHKLCWTCLCHPLSALTISNNNGSVQQNIHYHYMFTPLVLKFIFQRKMQNCKTVINYWVYDIIPSSTFVLLFIKNLSHLLSPALNWFANCLTHNFSHAINLRHYPINGF